MREYFSCAQLHREKRALWREVIVCLSVLYPCDAHVGVSRRMHRTIGSPFCWFSSGPAQSESQAHSHSCIPQISPLALAWDVRGHRHCFCAQVREIRSIFVFLCARMPIVGRVPFVAQSLWDDIWELLGSFLCVLVQPKSWAGQIAVSFCVWFWDEKSAYASNPAKKISHQQSHGRRCLLCNFSQKRQRDLA